MPTAIDAPEGSPEWCREVQQQLGLSDAALAAVMGLSQASAWRRHKVRDPSKGSHRELSPVAVRLLKAYLEGYRPADWPGA